MTQGTELWVDRQDLRKTRIVSAALPPLADGEVLLAIDQFALTSNNVSYATSGLIYDYLLDNKVSPNRGLMVSPISFA